jgi:hypothetical protein
MFIRISKEEFLLQNPVNIHITKMVDSLDRVLNSIYLGTLQLITAALRTAEV